VIEVRFKFEKETEGALRYQDLMTRAKSSNKPGPRSAFDHRAQQQRSPNGSDGISTGV